MKKHDFAERTIQIAMPVLCDVARRLAQLDTLHDTYDLMDEGCYKGACMVMHDILNKCIDLVEKHGEDPSYFIWRKHCLEDLECDVENIALIMSKVPNMISDRDRLEKSTCAKCCWDDFLTFIEYTSDWIGYMQTTPF